MYKKQKQNFYMHKSQSKVWVQPDSCISEEPQESHNQSAAANEYAVDSAQKIVTDLISYIPKQKPQYEIKTKIYDSIKINRPSKSIQTAQITPAQKLTEQGRQKFKQEAQKQMMNNLISTSKKHKEWTKKIRVSVIHAVKSGATFSLCIYSGISIIAILLTFLMIVTILKSPLGIFFSNEAIQDTVPLKSVVSQINLELDAQLLSMQAGEFDNISIQGAPPCWTDVIAVFACCIAQPDNGVSVAFLTDDLISTLRNIFWDMCLITSSSVTIEYPDSNPDDDLDDSRFETTLTITITSKTADEMRSVFCFTDFQNETMDILLSDTASLESLLGD